MEEIGISGWYLEGALDYKESLIISIDTYPFLIGRDNACNLTISSKNVSRRHAAIQQKAGHLYLNDLNSVNGTFVNQLRLVEPAILRRGDVLRFGNTEFRVNHKMQAEPQMHKTLATSMTEIGNTTGRFVDLSQEVRFLSMIKNAAVVTHFQPIVTLQEVTTIGYEVLGRGAYEGLPQDPRELLGIGKKLRKELELNELFRLKGLQLGASLPVMALLFLNTHPAEKLNLGFEVTLRRMRALSPNRPLALEIHESAITRPEEMKALSQMLKKLSIYLVYDDFGAGQARLIELAEVPPDFLKFDLSMTRDLHRASANKQEMVSKLVKIADEMGASTIAECVETAEEVEVCRQMGFSHAQGYFFGKPAPVTAFVQTHNS
jgi:EAL domain-containing protein (putative c-di-GMP-specific phosphodiesterase class I)